MARRRLALAAATLVALAFSVVAAGCSDSTSKGEAAEAHREGLAEELGGLDYNVYITRQLNLNLPEDRTYYDGPPAPAGSALYGVFIEVCNPEDGEPAESAEEFVVRDTQGNEFEPVELPEDNTFAYHPRVLQPGSCIPPRGSIAQLGPTGGAMLLFEFPQEATENRPLELEIVGEHDLLEGEPEKLEVELDL